MTLSELKKKVDELYNRDDLSEDSPVTVCDLTNDADEHYHFLKVNGVDTVKVNQRREIVVVVFES